MKGLKLIFCILFISISLFSYDRIIHKVSSSTSEQYLETVSAGDYIYERKYINGMWWIYVYDEDGSLVNVYPDVWWLEANNKC